MNPSTNIRQLVLIAALAGFALFAGPVRAADNESQRYIVILKSRSGPAPDVAHLGGIVTFRQDDEVIVTLPPSALAALKADPLVRYVQNLAGTDPGAAAPLAGEPDEPTAGAPRRLVPHATAGNLSWSKLYTYDDASNIINIGSQQYAYDALGRLTEMATDGNQTEKYDYDRYGNQTSRTTSAGLQAINTDPTTNRLSSGYGYDVAGNVTSGESYVLAYDPLGQTATKTYTGTTTFNETYIYTASDERIGVKTSNSADSSSWWYWSVRDEGGKVLRQYRSSANDPTQAALWIEGYVYRDGQLVGAERPPTLGGRRHFHLDHLGSPRLITSDAGLIVSTHDYLPFGGETTSVFTETQAGFDREDPMKFTGHERDYPGSFGREDEHAIDYMHARYYSLTTARFLSVDPELDLEVALNEPQGWNRYSYVRNNPAKFTDPTGRIVIADDIAVGLVIGTTILAEAYLQAPSASDPSHTNAAVISATISDALDVVRGDLTWFAEHVKGARPSTVQKHQDAQARRNKDRGGEKADPRRRAPRKRPPGHKGPWPPRTTPLPPPPDDKNKPTPTPSPKPKPPAPKQESDDFMRM